MKILYISWSIIPSRSANSIQVMKMCQAFSDNGHDVLLVVRKGDVKLSESEIYNIYGVRPVFAIKQIPKFGFPGGSYLLAFWSILIGYKYKADIIYSRILSSWLIGFTLRKKTIFEAHTSPQSAGQTAGTFLPYLYRFNLLHRIISISEALKDHLIQCYNFHDSFVKVAHDAADKPEDVMPLKFKNTCQIQIGYIGQLYKGKGMEIIAQLVYKCPWAFFHIIGGTDDDLIYWRKQLNQVKNIKFYGFINPSKTEAFRQSVDVLVAPYSEQVAINGNNHANIGRWMSPLKIFEYMASGKPMIVSKMPVLMEVLEHNRNALLCSSEDIQEWKEALLLLKRHPKTGRIIAQNAKEEFENKFTWKNRARLIIEQIV